MCAFRVQVLQRRAEQSRHMHSCTPTATHRTRTLHPANFASGPASSSSSPPGCPTTPDKRRFRNGSQVGQRVPSRVERYFLCVTVMSCLIRCLQVSCRSFVRESVRRELRYREASLGSQSRIVSQCKLCVCSTVRAWDCLQGHKSPLPYLLSLCVDWLSPPPTPPLRCRLRLPSAWLSAFASVRGSVSLGSSHLKWSTWEEGMTSHLCIATSAVTPASQHVCAFSQVYAIINSDILFMQLHLLSSRPLNNPLAGRPLRPPH
jgi:hypothetical protein